MIPISTDRRLRHTPWVNIALIVLNVVVHLWKWQATSTGGGETFERFYFHPDAPQWYQYFTYQFIHGNLTHILFNMVFLYVFGNSLEDRFGPIGYLFFYLAGGVVAGIGYGLTMDNPMIGASGSIAAVTGAFLALFPMTRVTLLWIFGFTLMEVPSMYFILLAFFRDLFFQWSDAGGVAYLAHISGSVFGFLVGMSLLAARVVPREPYDFLALLKHWNRRRSFRAMARQNASPWQGDAADRMQGVTITQTQEQAMRLRSAIHRALASHDGPSAVAAFEQLLALDPQHVLPKQTQLDLANYAMNAQRYAAAAQAYEGFLRVYPHDEYSTSGQVHFILGLIYGRYTGELDRARPLLVHAAKTLRNPAQKEQAQELLAEIGGV